MKKSVMTMALSAVTLAVAISAQAISISSGNVVPGEWNSNYYAAKQYAEETATPMIIFWSSPGCGFCTKMKKAVDSTTFTNWVAEKKPVLVAVEGKGTPENAACKAFVKNSTGKFPYMSIYWRKADGSVVHQNFSGRDGFIPAAGSTKDVALINAFNKFCPGWSGSDSPTPGPTPTPEPDPIDPSTIFEGGFMLDAAYLDASGNVGGVMRVTCGKANARTKKCKVGGKIVTIAGKKKSFSGYVDAGANAQGVFNIKGIGTLSLTFTRGAYSGTFAGYTVTPMSYGGSFGDAQSVTFHLNGVSAPALPAGYSMLNELLPGDMSVSPAATVWNFGKSGIVNYVKKDGAFVLKGADSANPSGLKISYRSSTGILSGSFKVTASNAGAVPANRKPLIKKYTYKIAGLVVNNVGYFYVYHKNAIVGSGYIFP